jgi:hypothetical protein
MKTVNIKFFASAILMVLFFITALMIGDVIFQKMFLAISIVSGLKFLQISNHNSIAYENN